MKAYIAIKYHPDGRNRTKIEMLSEVLAEQGWASVCVFRDLENWGRIHFDPNELMRKSFEFIDSSDLIVIDLTEKGVGIGIEAGYAFARNVQIVTVAEEGADISTTLKGISNSVFHYRNRNDLNSFFSELGETRGKRERMDGRA